MSIEIIQALNDIDLQKCLKIRKEVFVEEQKVPLEEEVDRFEKSSTHFLAFYQKEPVATGRYRISGGILKFERFAVLFNFRGKGIAKVLFKDMFKEGRKKYPHHLPFLSAQVQVLGFYKKFGWIVISDVYMDAGIEHVMMIYPPKNQKEIEELICLKELDTPKEIIHYFKQRM